jgi:hypothetical protein
MNPGGLNMKKAALAVLFLSFAIAIAAVPAFADSVLYNNTTAYSGTGVAYGIFGGNETTDSFTLASSATVTSVSFDFWAPVPTAVPSSTPASIELTNINWSIGTSAFGASWSGTGVAPTSYTYLDTVNDNGGQPYFYYQVYSVSLSIPDIDLGPGTYWLTLDNAVSDAPYDYWEVSKGASSAYFNSTGDSIPSETFEILGPGSSVPEGGPGLLYLMMAGALCLGCTVAVKRSRLSQLSPGSRADKL